MLCNEVNAWGSMKYKYEVFSQLCLLPAQVERAKKRIAALKVSQFHARAGKNLFHKVTAKKL